MKMKTTWADLCFEHDSFTSYRGIVVFKTDD